LLEPGRHNFTEDFVASNWLLIASEEDLSAIPEKDTVVIVEGHFLTDLSTEGLSVLLSWLEKGIPIAASGQIYPTMVSNVLGIKTKSHYGTSSTLLVDGLFMFEDQYIGFSVAGSGSRLIIDRIVQSIRSMVSGHKQLLNKPW